MNHMSAVAAGLLLAIPLSLFADDTADRSEGLSDNIVVTASRIPLPVAEVNSSFTEVPRVTIDNRQSFLATDLLRDVPGLAVSRSGGFGTTTAVRVRGAEANQVLVMIDGIKANDPGFGDTFRFENLTTYDIERIEVVRGPQSAIWGSDAAAGVINIITRTADEPMAASLFAEGGSFDTSNYGGRIAMNKDKWQFNTTASAFKTDGNNISRVGDEDDGYENKTISGRVGYAATEELSFSLTGRYVDSSTDFDGIDVDYSTDPPTGTGLPADADKNSKNRNGLVSAGVNYVAFDGLWTNDLTALLSKTDEDEYSDGVKGVEQQGETIEYRWLSSLDLSKLSDSQDMNALLFAVDQKRQEYQQYNPAGAFPPPDFLPVATDQTESMYQTGYALEYRRGLFKNAIVSAAARHDAPNDFDSKTTWRVTGSYLFAGAGTRVRAAAGTGFKAPTFTERFSYYPDLFIGNPDLQPETTEGWEIGIDQSVGTDTINIQLTYFNETLKNEINSFVFDPASFLYTARNVDGNSKRRGVEFGLQTRTWAGFGATVGYTYLDATQPDGAGGTEMEIRRPRNTGSVGLNYGYLGNRGNINLNASYTGDQDDYFFPADFNQPRETVQLDAYTLVNLAADFNITPLVRVFGRIENLFDKDYEDVYGFNTPGRGAFVGFSVGTGG